MINFDFFLELFQSWTSPRKVNFGVWNMIFVNWLVPWYCCCFLCVPAMVETEGSPRMPQRCAHYICMLHVSSILLEADLWNPLWGRFLNKKLMNLGSISAGERWKLWDEKQWKKSNIFGFWRTLLNRIPGLFWLPKASDSWTRKGFQFLFTAHFYI